MLLPFINSSLAKLKENPEKGVLILVLIIISVRQKCQRKLLLLSVLNQDKSVLAEAFSTVKRIAYSNVSISSTSSAKTSNADWIGAFVVISTPAIFNSSTGASVQPLERNFR